MKDTKEKQNYQRKYGNWKRKMNLIKLIGKFSRSLTLNQETIGDVIFVLRNLIRYLCITAIHWTKTMKFWQAVNIRKWKHRSRINQIYQITQTFKTEKEMHLNTTFCQLMSAKHETVLVLYEHWNFKLVFYLNLNLAPW